MYFMILIYIAFTINFIYQKIQLRNLNLFDFVFECYFVTL